MVFAIHWHESAMDLHMYPSWATLPPPSPSHPSGSSQYTITEHLSHASNLGWWSVSHLIIYMFQYYLSDHPTLIFSQRVQKSVLYICVSFSVLHIKLLLPYFYIPYICISILYWCLSFWLTSLCIMGSSFIHLIRTDSNVFFNGWVIFHGVYAPQLPYPFVCWWASRLLPCPGYYKQCCD